MPGPRPAGKRATHHLIPAGSVVQLASRRVLSPGRGPVARPCAEPYGRERIGVRFGSRPAVLCNGEIRVWAGRAAVAHRRPRDPDRVPVTAGGCRLPVAPVARIPGDCPRDRERGSDGRSESLRPTRRRPRGKQAALPRHRHPPPGSQGVPYKRSERDANRGRKSSKSNQDCTICRSCRETMIGPVVLKGREDRVEQREFGGPLTVPFAWLRRLDSRLATEYLAPFQRSGE